MNIKPKILERLASIDIRPSKGLGQNFLVESTAYEKIIKAGEIQKGETIVEVGPGLGTLTESLADAGAKIIAIEKDRKLISFLKSLFPGNENVTILEGDALEIDPHSLGLKSGNYKIIANIPYYITSRLLRNIFESWPQPKLIVLLLQREVAQRIIAQPPHMNILAISIQYFADPKIISTVPRGSFYPMPEVDSAIVRISPRKDSLEPGEDTKKFFRCVKIGFSSKRKKLINNLSAGFKISKEELKNLLIKSGIDPNARPENLTIENWQKLANLFGEK